MPRTPRQALPLALLAGLACAAAHAATGGAAAATPVATGSTTAAAPDIDDQPAGPGLTYALGLAVIDAPAYAGASGREQKLRPLWALRYGRFRLSGARASALLGPPGTEKHSGASADLVDRDRWSLNFGLRFDNGRSAADDPALAGLPDIRSTLRGRLAARWRLDGGFSTGLSYSADLLGRGGGGQVGWGVSYGWAPWPAARASVNLGATWADRRHMRSEFGITPEVALRTGRTPFEPGAGLVDLNAGLSLQVRLQSRWTLTSGLALTQLQGDAAASPLTRRSTGATASIALGWRSR